MLDESTAHQICEWITTHTPQIVDITGGAPELSDHFRLLVETSRHAGCEVIDRCNLTILEENGFEWLPDFLAAH
ncbi:MAG: radical SAM protein, partial [Pedosphaera sp.]|nr:radical SAM protein [Pedosphaera sp.]